MTAARLLERVDEIVAAQVRPRGPRSCVVRLDVPLHGIEHAAADGVARADSGRAATVDDRFHVASVGKPFTAVLVARAAAAGAFGPSGIDASLGELDRFPDGLARSIHPRGREITIRQLLTHTSGLKDMVTDDASGTADELGGPPAGSLIARYARSVMAVHRGEGDDGFARHRWTPWDPDRPDDELAGVLNLFTASGTAGAPVGHPGERFHYSDTAYVVLALLVQFTADRPFHEVQRDSILEPLGMVDTSMAYTADDAAASRADPMDVWLGPVPLLSNGFDLSFDWGGGGQVSTVADLIRFLRAVLEPTSGLLERDHPLTQWCVPSTLTAPRQAVGLGLFRWDAGGGRIVVGHAGAWGVRVFHDPTTGAWLAGTVNERNDGALMAEVFDAVEEELG